MKSTHDMTVKTPRLEKMSHSFLAVRENTSVLEKEMRKQMEVVLAVGDELVIL